VSGAPIKYSVTGPQTAGDSPPAAPSRADRTLVAATTLLLLAAPFAASAGLRGASLLLASAALCVHLRARLVQLRDRFPPGVLVAFLAWSALALASIAWSAAPQYTLSELKPELLYPAVALVAFFLAADATRWRLWWVALMAGTALAVAATVLQELLPFTLSRHSMDGGPGHFSTHLVLIAPLLFALVWPRPWGREHGAAALVVALAAIVALAWQTGNRMVWPALAAELLVGIAAWRSAARDASAASRTLVRMTLFAGVALTVAFAASVVERHERIASLKPREAASLATDLRPRIWAVAMERLREAPWLGHGFGREIRADAFIPVTPRSVPHPEIRHAHNVFLDVAIQLGGAGLAAFIALLAALALEYRRYLRDPALAPLGIMGLALLAGFVAKNLTDDFLYRHNALVFWAINGMLLGLARARGR
jgi:O-antigen ligase